MSGLMKVGSNFDFFKVDVKSSSQYIMPHITQEYSWAFWPIVKENAAQRAQLGKPSPKPEPEWNAKCTLLQKFTDFVGIWKICLPPVKTVSLRFKNWIFLHFSSEEDSEHCSGRGNLNLDLILRCSREKGGERYIIAQKWAQFQYHYLALFKNGLFTISSPNC